MRKLLIFIVAVAVVAAVSSVATSLVVIRRERSVHRDEIASLTRDFRTEQHNLKFMWAAQLDHLRLDEPSGLVGHDGRGGASLHLARIVSVDATGAAFTFDWLGRSELDDGVTNRHRTTQTMWMSPVGTVLVQVPDDPDAPGWRRPTLPHPVDLRVLLNTMRSHNESSTALLESAWWVGTLGPKGMDILIQASLPALDR